MSSLPGAEARCRAAAIGSCSTNYSTTISVIIRRNQAVSPIRLAYSDSTAGCGKHFPTSLRRSIGRGPTVMWS